MVQLMGIILQLIWVLGMLQTPPSSQMDHHNNPVAEKTDRDFALTSICVYCGSGAGHDPAFAQSAKSLGQDMARNSIKLVYGGGTIGLMGIVAQSVLDHGGEVCGIIPDFLKKREMMLENAQETLVTQDMHERKRLMYERADAFVALPGGIGTLEELVEQMTWAQLGQHGKPILLLSINSFWKPLLNLLAHMREHGFIRPGLELNYLVAEKAEDIIPMLKAYKRHASHQL
jgi:uncharacterized protein (TIGR00730 family)